MVLAGTTSLVIALNVTFYSVFARLVCFGNIPRKVALHVRQKVTTLEQLRIHQPEHNFDSRR